MPKNYSKHYRKGREQEHVAALEEENRVLKAALEYGARCYHSPGFLEDFPDAMERTVADWIHQGEVTIHCAEAKARKKLGVKG